MNKITVLSYRYAHAFLNVFFSSLTVEDFSSICKARAFFYKHKQACFLMRLNLLDDQIKLKELARLSLQWGLSDSFQKLFALLIADKRSSLLPSVFSALCRLYKKRAGVMEFGVESAGELTEGQKKQIKDFLEGQTQKKIICSYKQNEHLIAGVRLQSNYLLWEDSIRNRLNSIRRALRA